MGGRARFAAIAGGVVLAGLLGWAALWATVRPRAVYDTLWYSMYAYQYAGESVAQSWDDSWRLVHEYGDVTIVSPLHRYPDGSWWAGWQDPTRARWIGLYRMRPVMPLVSSVAVPLLGVQAPLVASALAVVAVVSGAVLLLGTGIGVATVVLFAVGMLANPLLSPWLVTLTTDGLGIALILLTTVCLARYVAAGDRRWLIGSMVAAIVLAFTRQSGTILAPAMAVAALVAWLGGGPWRRFAVASAAMLVPIALFAAYAAVAGLPSFSDMLQDVPTVHYSRPDIPNVIGYLLRKDLAVARAMLPTIPAQPWVWLPTLLAAAGFLLRWRWWQLAFVALAVTTPLLLAAHPVIPGAARTLAPAWVTVSLGLALLVSAAIDRVREHTGLASG